MVKRFEKSVSLTSPFNEYAHMDIHLGASSGLDRDVNTGLLYATRALNHLKIQCVTMSNGYFADYGYLQKYNRLADFRNLIF